MGANGTAKLRAQSWQATALWPPTGCRVGTGSGKGLMQDWGVSAGPFGQGILGACLLGPTHPWAQRRRPA